MTVDVAQARSCPVCDTALLIDGDGKGLCPACQAGLPAESPTPRSQSSGQVGRAAKVLDTLVDARLLTSYEVPAGDDQPPRRRIEIVHESLLSHWPRLVRWRTQDQEGAQLRDELRAQAELWDQHDRSEDYLWTSAAYLDFLAWKQHYPGGLTMLEEAYGEAMTRHAERRTRRRRAALAVLFSTLAAVLVVVTWSRFEAVAEARRAEAAKLLALGQVQLDIDPTEALAFAIASLELADSEEARIFAVRALWEGPPVLALRHDSLDSHFVPSFSPDGRWFSAAAAGGATTVLVWSRDGSGPIELDGHPPASGMILTAWTPDNQLVTGHAVERRARIWSFPGGELVRQIDFGDPAWWQLGESRVFAELIHTDAETGHQMYRLRSWDLSDGKSEELGAIDRTAIGAGQSVFDPTGRGWVYFKQSEILYRPLPVRDGVPDRLIGAHENRALFVDFPASRDRIWTRDSSTGELRLWDLAASSPEPLQVLASPPDLAPGTAAVPALEGRWLHEAVAIRDGKALLWDPTSLPGARPRELKRSGRWHFSKNDFHPSGDWIVASSNYGTELSFWPLQMPTVAVVNGYDTMSQKPLMFTPDGKWLVSYWGQDKLRLWPLPDTGEREIQELDVRPAGRTGLDIDPAGKQVLATGSGNDLFVVPLEGGPPKHLEGFLASTYLLTGAFSPDGRLAATATAQAPEERMLRVWDLDADQVKAFELPPPQTELGSDESGSGGTAPLFLVGSMGFVDDSTLLTAGASGVLRWNLETGAHEQIVAVAPGQLAYLWLSRDRTRAIIGLSDPAGDCGPLVLHDLVAGQSRNLESFFTCSDLQIEAGPPIIVFDETLAVMAIGRSDGTLWVGRVDGGEPHLLTGHRGAVAGLALSPDGSWIASSGEDKTLRLWPMPDLDEPPLHTLAQEQLLAKLQGLTNLRAVRDESSSTGWSIEIGPFPGWAEVPAW